MLKLLSGHVSPETARVVDDYPYGRQLRCKIRYWVESPDKGSGKGRCRAMSQTTNPKTDNKVWNKPKAGNYYDFVFMYEDPRNGYTRFYPIGHYGNIYEDNFALFFATGLYGQLDNETKEKVDKALVHSRKYNLTTSTEWAEKLARVKAYTEANGFDAPNMYETGEFNSGAGYIYEKSFYEMLAFVKAEKGIYTLPALSETS